MEPKRFLITGGSQGIGAALVGLACEAGHTVVCTGRHEETLARVARETGAVGVAADGRAVALPRRSRRRASDRDVPSRNGWHRCACEQRRLLV